MCSSAILEMIGVSDIGRKCLLTSLIGLNLTFIEISSAHFTLPIDFVSQTTEICCVPIV